MNGMQHLKAAVGDHPVQEVCLCPTTKKLMIRLDDTCDRSVCLCCVCVCTVCIQYYLIYSVFLSGQC